MLPDHMIKLSETVDHELGQVYYYLKAAAERLNFSINYTNRKSIRVSRMLLSSSLELTQPMVISNTWMDKLSYDISVPSKTFTMRNIIPITFALLPIAPDLQVRSVSCVLKKYITLTCADHSKMEEKQLNIGETRAFHQGKIHRQRQSYYQCPTFNHIKYGRIQFVIF
ncbi:hypothetical protein CU097_013206 [Rhizopus azygosporus]|uniref:Arrestin C-terminal-like domain-containing protein n=1 Tax=Rhizopus azygosporus TaxID=86630 RepID=A0A367K0C7_RHIAZ|nr:hypothetical protein CU097_013206 [Rhizopus azygosporus]